MFTSFSTALSALSAHTTAIDVIGNNLANLNTPGYKASVVVFSDLVTQSLGAGLGETQVGFGVATPTTIRQFTQGAIESSSGSLDVAIQGDGFLIVKDPNSGATLYTRGGNLQVNSDGELVTSTGYVLQGWNEAGGVLDTNAPTTNVVIPVGSLRAPTATTALSFDMNLDASAEEGDTFSTPISIYDSLGVSHTVTATFTKTANQGEWDYSVSIPGSDTTSGTVTPATGTLQFDEYGKLSSPTSTDTAPELTISDLSDGAATLSITWNIFNGSDPRITQSSAESAVSANTQNGSAAAQLTKVGIGDGGTILAQYSNGEQVVVGQLAMATIRNPESLIAAGSNNYMLSSRTALPAVGLPDTGGRGEILGGSVEYSTVDIATEFTNLIVYQRGYQANSKVITTVDEISQDTINLKR
jgi:flagellar hook protein FlgE